MIHASTTFKDTTLHPTAKKLIDEKLLKIEKQIENGEEPSGFIAGVLAKQMISTNELYSNISELMAAAVDTVCIFQHIYPKNIDIIEIRV